MKQFILFFFLMLSTGQAQLKVINSIDEIVGQLKNSKYELALKNILESDFNKISNDQLLLLTDKIIIKEIPHGLDPDIFLELSTEGIRILNIVENRLKILKVKMDVFHPIQLQHARALYNLSKFVQARKILESILEEKKFGADNFEELFLLGAIAAKQNDWNGVTKTYAKIMALATRLRPDLKRDLRIRTEWAGAYENVQNNQQLIQKGRGLAMLAKGVQINILDDESLKDIEKANYLFIHYSKMLGINIKALKKDFLKHYPNSRYVELIINM